MKISQLVSSLFCVVGVSLVSPQVMANTSSGSELPSTPLAKIEKLTIYHGGYGSDAFIDPKNPSRFYVLADRGPNADAAEKIPKYSLYQTIHLALVIFNEMLQVRLPY